MRIWITAFCFLFLGAQLNAQKNLHYISHKYYPAGLNDIWGYTDTFSIEYALVGLRNGVSIAQITTGSGIPGEVFFVSDTFSTWRDIKTWNKHAYVTNETYGGLLIIDLSKLPYSIDTLRWTGDTLDFQRAHNIFIDEKGIAYLFGSNIGNQGALMLDLTNDPKNPELVGMYNDAYVHDGFARGDTLWTSEIYDGELTAIDVSVKSAPIVMGSIQTPHLFAHNCWLSDDGKYAFTTDEKPDATIAAFDVSDLGNMQLLSTNKTHPGSLSIPHNTYYINGFLVTSYYRNGVTIVDANRPENLVETGYYDTSPFLPGQGYEGCWGVYPYLPSGDIVASDRQEGLFVLRPEYVRACYIEGNVTESQGFTALPGAKVEVIGTDHFDVSDYLGDYKTGVADSGLVDLRVTHPNCLTTIIGGVAVDHATISHVNIQLDCINLSAPEGVLNPILSLFADMKGNIYYKSAHDLSSPLQLNIMTMQGQVVQKQYLNEFEGMITLSSLPTGLYIAKISSENTTATIRFILP